MSYAGARLVTDRQTDTHTHRQTDYNNPLVHAHRALMKAMKCKTLGTELAMHAVYLWVPFKSDDYLPTLNTHLTLIRKGRRTNLSRTSTSMNCKWPTWPCKNEKRAITRERVLAKSATWKPLEFSEDLAGKFNLSHIRLTLELEWQHTHRQTDYHNPLAHPPSINKAPQCKPSARAPECVHVLCTHALWISPVRKPRSLWSTEMWVARVSQVMRSRA